MPLCVAMVMLGILAQQGTTPPATQATPQTGAAPKYLIRLKGNVGDTYEYDSDLSITFVDGGPSMSVKSKLVDTLARVNEEQQDWESVLTLRETSATPELDSAIKVFQFLNGKKVTSVKNDRGRVLKIVLDDLEMPSRGTGDVNFSKSEVAIGDSWDAPVEANGRVFQIRYWLMKVFNDRGRDTFLIQGWFHPDQEAKTIEPTTFWVDVATGHTVYISGATQVTSKGKTLEMRQRLELKKVTFAAG